MATQAVPTAQPQQAPTPTPDDDLASAAKAYGQSQDELAHGSVQYASDLANQTKANLAQEKADAPGADLQYQAPPDEKLPEVRPPVEALLKWLPMLAIIGAGASRTASYGALRAAAGVMQGQKEGDTEARDRAHEEYVDQMKKLEETNKIVSQKLDDAWKKVALDRDEGAAALNAVTAQYDLVKDRAAIASGQWKVAHDLYTAREAASKNVLEAHHQAFEEGLGVARLNQEAANAAATRQDHRDDMQLRLKEMGDARLETHAIHERDKLDALPQTKAWDAVQGTEKFLQEALDGKIDLTQRANQVAILDAFSRRANNGQALRGFMLKSAQDQLGLQAAAERSLSQLKDPQAKLLSTATLNGYLHGAKVLGDDMTRAYADEIRNRAPIYQANGIPLELILTPDEQKLLAGSSQAPAPSADGWGIRKLP